MSDLAWPARFGRQRGVAGGRGSSISPPSLSQVARQFLAVGDILIIPGGGSAPGGRFCVVYP
jgi:hypothetical protein